MTRVPDDQPAEITHARQLRIVAEVLGTLLRSLPGVDRKAAEACARNLAAGWGEYGLAVPLCGAVKALRRAGALRKP